jgi:hypothetical protein
VIPDPWAVTSDYLSTRSTTTPACANRMAQAVPARPAPITRTLRTAGIKDHAIGDSITVQEMIETPMVVAYSTRTGRNTAVHQMQLAGLEPMVDTVTESFLIVPFLIAGTDRLGLVPAMLARRLFLARPGGRGRAEREPGQVDDQLVACDEVVRRNPLQEACLTAFVRRALARILSKQSLSDLRLRSTNPLDGQE